MKIPKEYGDKVKRYIALHEESEKLFEEVSEWLNEYSADCVYINSLFITTAPTGQLQNDDEYCDQWAGYCEDDFSGNYYHQIEGSEENEVAEWMRCTHNHIDVSDYWYCKSGSKKVGWRRGTRQNWYMERNPDAKLDKNGVLKICPRKFDRNFNGWPIGCEKDRCDKPMCDRCRGTYWEHEVVFNENGRLRSLLE